MTPLSVLHNSVIVLLVVCAVVVSGCHEDSPASLIFHSPHVRLVNQPSFFIDSTFHRINISVTVENDGDGPIAFNVSYFIKLKKGNHIVDQTGLFFGSLEQHESLTETSRFSKTTYLSDYDHIEAVLYWYDAENRYYQ